MTAPHEPTRPSELTSQSTDTEDTPSESSTTTADTGSPNPDQTTVGISTTTLAPPTPAPGSQAGVGSGGVDVLVTAIFSGAVLAALLTSTINILLARRKSLEEERARLRDTFAEAFEAVVRYKEMPYAIRRRNKDAPGAERVRLVEEMREIQAKLSYFQMWTAGESVAVGDSYVTLVQNLRRTAGKACHDAWIADPISHDLQMNIGPDLIDLREMEQFEKAYIKASQDHLDGFLRFHRLFKPVHPKHAKQ
ncbi:MAG: hypothetical protein WBB00_02455 [Mycobacterium sp.]